MVPISVYVISFDQAIYINFEMGPTMENGNYISSYVISFDQHTYDGVPISTNGERCRFMDKIC